MHVRSVAKQIVNVVGGYAETGDFHQLFRSCENFPKILDISLVVDNFNLNAHNNSERRELRLRSKVLVQRSWSVERAGVIIAKPAHYFVRQAFKGLFPVGSPAPQSSQHRDPAVPVPAESVAGCAQSSLVPTSLEPWLMHRQVPPRKRACLPQARSVRDSLHGPNSRAHLWRADVLPRIAQPVTILPGEDQPDHPFPSG